MPRIGIVVAGCAPLVAVRHRGLITVMSVSDQQFLVFHALLDCLDHSGITDSPHAVQHFVFV